MLVKHFQTIENELKSIGFNEGTLYYTTDTKRVYLDPIDEKSRICVSSDPIILNTENDRTDLLAPIPGKIYFVIETSKSYIFYNGNWYDSTHKELPDYSAEDNDKVLKIVDGVLTWTTMDSDSDILKTPKIVIDALPGSTITCSNGSITKVGTENNGQWIFSDLTLNEAWTITAIWNGVIVTKNVTFTEIKIEFIHIQYRVTPEFTYTGDYEIVDDTDSKIIDFATWTHDWKIRFLTSGELTFTNMHGWKNTNIDVFAVGGGSGAYNYNAGAGGYTKTQKGIYCSIGVIYNIEIGNGGVYKNTDKRAGDGGNTSGFGVIASGAKGAYSNSSAEGRGGDGGSGGSGYRDGIKGIGGVDGGDGQDGNWQKKGYGQITKPGIHGETGSTREFSEPNGTLYASGGCVSGGINNGLTGPNSGRGGDGGKSGECGILIIRNTREVA